MTQPALPPWWRHLLGWRFWCNVALILAATCWIPLTSSRLTMTDHEGAVVRNEVQSFPVYQSYYLAATRGSRQHLQAVALHIGISVTVSVFTWWAVLRRRGEADLPADD